MTGEICNAECIQATPPNRAIAVVNHQERLAGPSNGDDSYQPAFSHFQSHYEGCFLSGTSMVSVHDLDTIANNTQHASLDCRGAIIELGVATSAPATGVRTQQPAARAAVVPAAAFRAVDVPTLPSRLPARQGSLARAGDPARAVFSPTSSEIRALPSLALGCRDEASAATTGRAVERCSRPAFSVTPTHPPRPCPECCTAPRPRQMRRCVGRG